MTGGYSQPPPAWCRKVLGVDAAAAPEDVRQAYLQKVRETHPDKGGSAELFRKVVKAFEGLAGSADESPEPEEAEELGTPSERFSLKEISKLAAQVRALNRDRRASEQDAVVGRREDREARRRRSDLAAAQGRKREVESRLLKALARAGRSELPAGVELCEASVVNCDLFRASLCCAGVPHHGPERRSIDEAEKDLLRLQRAAKAAGDDGVVRMVKILHKRISRVWH